MSLRQPLRGIAALVDPAFDRIPPAGAGAIDWTALEARCRRRERLALAAQLGFALLLLAIATIDGIAR